MKKKVCELFWPVLSVDLHQAVGQQWREKLSRYTTSTSVGHMTWSGGVVAMVTRMVEQDEVQIAHQNRVGLG